MMCFHPDNFGLPGLFHSRIRWRHATDRQTDRRTDRRTDTSGRRKYDSWQAATSNEQFRNVKQSGYGSSRNIIDFSCLEDKQTPPIILYCPIAPSVRRETGKTKTHTVKFEPPIAKSVHFQDSNVYAQNNYKLSLVNSLVCVVLGFCVLSFFVVICSCVLWFVFYNVFLPPLFQYCLFNPASQLSHKTNRVELK